MNKFSNPKCFPFIVLFLFINVSILYFLFTPNGIENYSDIIYIKPIEIDCGKLWNESSNITLFKKAETWRFNESQFTDNQLYTNIYTNCSKFLFENGYILNSVNTIEKTFKIAFSIVTYKSGSQVERLIRTIYRPWNYYCVHIDKKSSKEFVRFVEELVKCLHSKYKNIILTPNRVDVQWGKMSVLTADLNCMKELYERYKDWKYLINLTGQEFPLKTNAELVKILQAYKGANNLEAHYILRHENRIPKAKLPFPIVWYKGSVHITANHDFIAFIFESPKSKILLDALKNEIIPDETFFTSLNFNPQFRIPGSFIGNPDENVPKEDYLGHFMTRYKNWGQYSCNSKTVVREICIWGVGDLPKLIKAPQLFANKFHEEFQPATLRCLERWYYNKVEMERKTGKIAINSSFYSSLPFVKYQYIPPKINN